jgi:light-regulated signal transduction histidine kinase (bacteriophytochrome)
LGNEFVHPDDLPRVLDAYEHLLDRPDPVTSPPYRVRRKDGTFVWIETTVRAVRDPATGEAIELQAAARDISARMRADQALGRANEELARSNAELERSNAELERFAYDASHDLGQPLRVMDQLMERLTREHGDEMGPDELQICAAVLDGIERMQVLMADLLEYSRVSSEPLARRSVDCSEIVEEARELLTETIAEKHGSVTAGPLPSVEAHPAQLRQLFQNLISNALKFAREGDSLRVTINAERHDGGWRFAVVDNGIGINPSDSQRIFEMFRRLHAPDAYAGTGMGLSICKRIVERHGGRIWVEPAPGGGSAFFFTIPDLGESH